MYGPPVLALFVVQEQGGFLRWFWKFTIDVIVSWILMVQLKGTFEILPLQLSYFKFQWYGSEFLLISLPLLLSFLGFQWYTQTICYIFLPFIFLMRTSWWYNIKSCIGTVPFWLTISLASMVKWHLVSEICTIDIGLFEETKVNMLYARKGRSSKAKFPDCKLFVGFFDGSGKGLAMRNILVLTRCCARTGHICIATSLESTLSNPLWFWYIPFPAQEWQYRKVTVPQNVW